MYECLSKFDTVGLDMQIYKYLYFYNAHIYYNYYISNLMVNDNGKITLL